MTTITLSTIEEQSAHVAKVRQELADAVAVLQAGIDTLKQQAGPNIRAALAAYNTAEDALRAMLSGAPSLFEKPRTRVFHGLKVGYQKGKGGLSIDDDLRCVALIKKHFPDQVDVLIRVTEKPVKDALEQLSASDLKKLGVHIVEADDQVVLRAIESDIDKLIKALTGDPLLQEGTPS